MKEVTEGAKRRCGWGGFPYAVIICVVVRRISLIHLDVCACVFAWESVFMHTLKEASKTVFGFFEL